MGPGPVVGTAPRGGGGERVEKRRGRRRRGGEITKLFSDQVGGPREVRSRDPERPRKSVLFICRHQPLMQPRTSSLGPRQIQCGSGAARSFSFWVPLPSHFSGTQTSRRHFMILVIPLMPEPSALPGRLSGRIPFKSGFSRTVSAGTYLISAWESLKFFSFSIFASLLVCFSSRLECSILPVSKVIRALRRVLTRFFLFFHAFFHDSARAFFPGWTTKQPREKNPQKSRQKTEKSAHRETRCAPPPPSRSEDTSWVRGTEGRQRSTRRKVSLREGSAIQRPQEDQKRKGGTGTCACD